MKIIKYSEFIRINENIHDTPEEYIRTALTKIKNVIDGIFSGQKKVGEEQDSQEVKKFSKNEPFNLNVELQSSEISTYSKSFDNLKVIYSDDKYRYDLTITINLEDAVPEKEDKDFSDKNIKKCYTKFKVYDITEADFKLKGELTKTVDIKDITEDFLVKLKVDFDKEFGEDKDDFAIETE